MTEQPITHITIPGTFGYEDIPAIAAKVWVEKMGAPKKGDKAKLAVMEICQNAIEHGCKNDPHKTVAIDLYQHGSALVMEVYDTGDGFTATQSLQATPPVIPKEPPPVQDNRRGVGIYTVSKLVDKLEYPLCDKGTLVFTGICND